MTTRWAMSKDGVVVNVAVFDDEPSSEYMKATAYDFRRLADDEQVSPGDIFDGKVYTKPPELIAIIQQREIESIDAETARIQSLLDGTAKASVMAIMTDSETLNASKENVKP